MSTEKYTELEHNYVANIYHPLDVVIERAEGVWMYDVEGKRYLDCLSAYSAVNQGHCHPRIIQTLKSQAEKVTLTSRAFHNDQLAPWSEKICKLSGKSRVLPMNTGAEAVETATQRQGFESLAVHAGVIYTLGKIEDALIRSVLQSLCHDGISCRSTHTLDG